MGKKQACRTGYDCNSHFVLHLLTNGQPPWVDTGKAVDLTHGKLRHPGSTNDCSQVLTLFDLRYVLQPRLGNSAGQMENEHIHKHWPSTQGSWQICFLRALVTKEWELLKDSIIHFAYSLQRLMVFLDSSGGKQPQSQLFSMLFKNIIFDKYKRIHGCPVWAGYSHICRPTVAAARK